MLSEAQIQTSEFCLASTREPNRDEQGSSFKTCCLAIPLQPAKFQADTSCTILPGEVLQYGLQSSSRLHEICLCCCSMSSRRGRFQGIVQVTRSICPADISAVYGLGAVSGAQSGERAHHRQVRKTCCQLSNTWVCPDLVIPTNHPIIAMDNPTCNQSHFQVSTCPAAPFYCADWAGAINRCFFFRQRMGHPNVSSPSCFHRPVQKEPPFCDSSCSNVCMFRLCNIADEFACP